MVQTSWPFADQEVTADVSEAQLTAAFRAFATGGVIGDPGGPELQVFSEGVGNRQVSVRVGPALVRGHYYVNDAQVDIPLDENATGLLREDRLVLRLDPGEPLPADRIKVTVLKGTAGSGPPALTRTLTGIYDEPLGVAPVPSGATTVLTSQVRDERHHSGIDIVPCRTVANVGADRRRFGTLAVESATGLLKRWNGASWAASVFSDDARLARPPRLRRARTGSASYAANTWQRIPLDEAVASESAPGGSFTYSSVSRSIGIGVTGLWHLEARGRSNSTAAMRIMASLPGLSGVEQVSQAIPVPLGQASCSATAALTAGSQVWLEQFFYSVAGVTEYKDAAGASLTVTRVSV